MTVPASRLKARRIQVERSDQSLIHSAWMAAGRVPRNDLVVATDDIPVRAAVEPGTLAEERG
jgi:hypothetical protein